MKTKHIEGNVLSIEAINRMLNSRVDNLTKMVDYDGKTRYEFEYDAISGTIVSNGASALVEIVLDGMLLIPYGDSVVEIPAYLAPIDDTMLGTTKVGFEAFVKNEELPDGKHAYLQIYNPTNREMSDSCTFSGVYTLGAVSVPEVIDMRVGYDGTQYDTAGEAIREQLSKAMELAEGGGYIGKDGCAEGDVNLDGNSINGVEVLVIGDSESDRGFAITYMGQHDDDDAQVAEFAGVVGDEAVRMRNIAPGVQDKDAVNMEQFTGATDLLDDINADVGQLMDSLGDIDSALDAIIAIQNELIGIITFYIYSTEFTAEKGMTWGEWLESDYYSDILYLDGINIVSDDGPVYTPDGNAVTTSDVIIANCEYTH